MAYVNSTPGISSRQFARDHLFEQSFSDDPVAYLIETMIASEPAWSKLPGLARVYLDLALSELERVEV